MPPKTFAIFAFSAAKKLSSALPNPLAFLASWRFQKTEQSFYSPLKKTFVPFAPSCEETTCFLSRLSGRKALMN
jgi:hypothetical protein